GHLAELRVPQGGLHELANPDTGYRTMYRALYGRVHLGDGPVGPAALHGREASAPLEDEAAVEVGVALAPVDRLVQLGEAPFAPLRDFSQPGQVFARPVTSGRAEEVDAEKTLVRRRHGRFLVDEPAPQFLAAGGGDRVLLAPARSFRSHLDQLRRFELAQLAIELTLRRVPDVAHRLLEAFQQVIAAPRLIVEQPQHRMSKAHIGYSTFHP